MDTEYVLNAIRAYGRAVRTHRPMRIIDEARDRALQAIAEAGAGIRANDIDRYAAESQQCGNRALEIEERGAAGGRAIQMIISMEQTIRARLGEPRQPS